MANTFNNIYKTNGWGGNESISGTGSSLDQTAVIRKEIPAIIKKIGANSILDIPCGDFNWMSGVKLDIDYIGGDIVPDLVSKNNKNYQSDMCKFLLLDITKDQLPAVDVILCRDCLVHFSIRDIDRAIGSIKRSGSKYLFTTTFTGRHENPDIETGSWRPINLQLSPFSFPEAIELINEQCTENGGIYSDKCLGLWRIDDI
jgi:hypothetical protein